MIKVRDYVVCVKENVIYFDFKGARADREEIEFVMDMGAIESVCIHLEEEDFVS